MSTCSYENADLQRIAKKINRPTEPGRKAVVLLAWHFCEICEMLILTRWMMYYIMFDMWLNCHWSWVMLSLWVLEFSNAAAANRRCRVQFVVILGIRIDGRESSTAPWRCIAWVWTGTLKLVSGNASYALLKTAWRFHQLHDTSGLWTSTSTIFDFPGEWMEKHCFSWTNPFMQDTVCASCLISESRNNNGTGTLASTVDDIILFFVAIFHDCWGQCTWQFVHALHVYTSIFFDKKDRLSLQFAE